MDLADSDWDFADLGLDVRHSVLIWFDLAWILLVLLGFVSIRYECQCFWLDCL